MAKTGVKQSEETREKRRLCMLGKNDWAFGNKNTLGKHWKHSKPSWNKGKKWSDSRRKAQERFFARPKTKPVIMRNKEYNPDWRETRRKIYKRDDWTCQECGIKCLAKNRKEKSRRIQCHHIDYDTKNDDFSNLITLCASCHPKTNFKRKDWIKYYKKKVRKEITL